MIGTTVQHYRILDRIGAGGMGEVYRADDLRLGRPVALKFLPPSLQSDPESRARLLNEARAASMLRSPNIAVTYDIGESDGRDFIVMEFVEGELLSSRVAKGALATREAIETGIQVADALDEAHTRGIIHRDIKSANLIRTERGLVKVLDFGLAKFVAGQAAADVTRQQMTLAGTVVGTVSYMAPEQALGKTVDGRADLFSLGVVLFEMLTGHVPFAGTTPTEIIDRILHEDAPPVSRFVSAVPTSLDAIVARALEKAPEFRYQLARDIHNDLKGVAAELDAGPLRSSRMAAAVLRRVESSVAVMTFANITREPADDWIGTGIAETVSSDLKNVHGLTVIGRARVYDALRNLSSDAHLNDSLAIDIGRRLGATWVIVGGYQRLGGMVRITANFVDVATGELRGTVKVDGKIEDIFALQDRIVYELSQGLNLALQGSEVAGIEKRETRSVEAYESYARGMMNLRQATRESIDRAIAAFEDATRHDPEYCDRVGGALGGAYGLKGSFLSINEMLHKAIELERRALAIDPDFSDAHIWLGSALLALGKSDEAIVSIKEAIRLEPDNGQAHQGLARALWVGKGLFAEAIPEFDRAIELNPEAGYSYLQLSMLLAWEGHYDRAEEICRRAVELQEQYISGNAGLQIVGAHSRLGYVHYLRGRYDEALRAYEREMAFVSSGDHALRERTQIELNVKIGTVYHRQGRTDDAGRHFDRALKAIRRASRAWRRRSLHALLHRLRTGTSRGDTSRALDSLRRVAPAILN